MPKVRTSKAKVCEECGRPRTVVYLRIYNGRLLCGDCRRDEREQNKCEANRDEY